MSRRYAGEAGSAGVGVLGLLFAAFVLTACGEPAARVLPPAAGPSATASVTATATPTARAKGRLDCGTYDLAQGETVPISAYQCFTDGVGSGRPARLKETKLSVEGGPNTDSYVGEANGRVEWTNDSRKDPLGAKALLRYTCTGPIMEQIRQPGDQLAHRMTFKKCSPARRLG